MTFRRTVDLDPHLDSLALPPPHTECVRAAGTSISWDRRLCQLPRLTPCPAAIDGGWLVGDIDGGWLVGDRQRGTIHLGLIGILWGPVMDLPQRGRFACCGMTSGRPGRFFCTPRTIIGAAAGSDGEDGEGEGGGRHSQPRVM